MTTSNFKPPNFANGLETPEYKTLLTLDNIELREYKESFWVTTEMVSEKENNSSGFWKLFKYISGQNETQEKISMTCPVVRKISPNNSISTMSFFLGYKYQNGVVPKPNGENTFIEKFPFKKVGIISYDGYTSKEKEEMHLKTLGDFLTLNSIKFSTNNYFTAGYDEPSKSSNRHNEV